MSFASKNGLFKLNITDCHAVLGVSLDAEPKQIRLRYLKIAQTLHPDKCRSDPAKMKVAGQILSKLVNPAYEQLSRKNTFAEHQLVLTQIGKRLSENKDKITVKSQAAQDLLKAGSSAELTYHKLLKKLTAEQYKSLEQATQYIEQISELNLVYLMLKGDRRINRQQTVPPNNRTNKKTKSKNRATATPAPPANTQQEIVEPTTESRVNAFVNRAQKYIARGEFDSAITELKDALRIEPNHGVAHAVMGKAYLYKKQLTMAKVHIGKACRAEPHNPIVMESKKALDKLDNKSNKSKARNSTSKNSKPDSSGFFSGFFGSRKK
ncbi:DnaJ domain-containing protein [Pleurocapsales cyanobacterium LEGE 10410]|nr:DnaJ domain-containing protein [Pleurocapsales cyanobacterium LEGE 10410]